MPRPDPIEHGAEGTAGLPAGQARTAPVLLLHGICSTGETLRPLAEAFRQIGRKVHAPTLCAPTRSDAGALSGALVRLTLDAVLDDAHRQARALFVATGRRPIIAGHSNGALLALALAAMGEAHGVALIAPAPPPSVKGIPVWMRRLMFTRVFGRGWQGRAICFEPHWPFAVERPPVEVMRTLCPDSGPAMAEAMNPARGSRFDPGSPLPCPALVVSGESDRLVPPRLARGVARTLSAVCELRPGAGHWLVADRREAPALCALILDHLAGDLAPAPRTPAGGRSIDRAAL